MYVIKKMFNKHDNDVVDSLSYDNLNCISVYLSNVSSVLCECFRFQVQINIALKNNSNLTVKVQNHVELMCIKLEELQITHLILEVIYMHHKITNFKSYVQIEHVPNLSCVSCGNDFDVTDVYRCQPANADLSPDVVAMHNDAMLNPNACSNAACSNAAWYDVDPCKDVCRCCEAGDGIVNDCSDAALNDVNACSDAAWYDVSWCYDTMNACSDAAWYDVDVACCSMIHDCRCHSDTFDLSEYNDLQVLSQINHIMKSNIHVKALIPVETYVYTEWPVLQYCIMKKVKPCINIIKNNDTCQLQNNYSMSVNKFMHMMEGNKKYLNVMYQNIPGTVSNYNLITTIESLLHREDPDILAIAEPTTDDLDHDWGVYKLVPGYIHTGNKIRLNILIKTDIVFTQKHWNVDIPHLTLDAYGWRLVFIYREWAKAGDQETKSIDQQLDRWKGFVDRWKKMRSNRSILIGDCNFDYWSTTKNQRQLAPIRDLVMNDVISSGWFQIIKENTRYQGNQKSCLDHIYTKSLADITTVHNRNVTAYDHNLVGVTLNVSKDILNPDILYYRDIKGTSIDDFAYIYHESRLGEFYSQTDVNEATMVLTHKIMSTLNIVAPIKRKYLPKKTSAPWMTSEIKAKIHERARLRSKAVRSNEDQDWLQFKVYRNKLKTMMLVTKKKWQLAQLSQKNPDQKARWRSIKRATGVARKQTQDIYLDVEGKVLTDPYDVAQHLNGYYVKKVKDIIDKAPPDPKLAMEYTEEYMKNFNVDDELEFKSVSISDVKRVISRLKSTSSVGHDELSTIVIKKFAEVICPEITRLVNMCIMTSTYPDSWKFGIISPVPKVPVGQDRRTDKNWRPVTLLCCLSKVLEKVINIQIKNYMESKGLIGESQHAYRRLKSCNTAWADIDTTVRHALDNGKVVGMLLVDMSAAFNLVSRDIIIPKLRRIGMGHFAAKLLRSYLTGRRSVTKISSVWSRIIAVDTGIGEGSVLGPLVFILTIICVTVVLARVKIALQAHSLTCKVNDGIYDTDVSVSSVEFADDCTGMCVADNDKQVAITLKAMAVEYKKYFEAHGLKINTAKSEHIIIGANRTQQVIIDGRPEAKKVKLLGVTFNNDYKFDDHVTNVTDKISKRLGQIRKITSVASPETSKEVASSICVSVAAYASEIYANEMALINRVQVKLNNVMRILTKAEPRTTISSMLTRLDWMTFNDIVKYNRIMLMYKLVIYPTSPFCKLFIWRGIAELNERYQLRERELRIAWKVKKVRQGDKSFLVQATKLYNHCKLFGKIKSKDDLKEYVKKTIHSWHK